MSKLISVKLNEDTFRAVEKLTHEQHISRNAYINQALRFMNRLYSRRRLRNEIRKESLALRSESLEVLKEFEAIQDEGL
jgi:hypothetical protein